MDPEKEKRFRFQMQLEQEMAANAVPNAPAENAGLYDLGQSIQNGTNAVIGPLARAGDTAGRAVSNLYLGTDKPIDYAQKALGAFSDLGNKAGEAVSGATGYAAQKLATATGANEVPMASHYASGLAGLAVSQIPQLLLAKYLAGSKPGEALPGAEGAARRTIFGKKSAITQMGGDIDKATAVGKEMLDKGVITPIASKETMMNRANDIYAAEGKKIGQIPTAMDSIAIKGIDTNRVTDEIKQTLSPRLKKGAFASDQAALQEVLDTVQAAGPDASFADAQAIKQKLQDLGRFPKGQNVSQLEADKINLFRRASGIFNRHMEDAMTRESPAISQVYQTAKANYAPAAMAKKGLKGEVLSEAANVQPSLRATLAGGEALGRGDISKAAMILGGADFLAKKGNQLAAYTLGKAIPNTALSPMARQAALAAFVDKITTKENSQ